MTEKLFCVRVIISEKMKSLFVKVLGSFFLLGALPIVILTEVLYLSQSSSKTGFPSFVSRLIEPEVQVVTLGQEAKKAAVLNFQVIAADARPLLLKKYLECYHSPLAPLADFIFAVSQKYGLDYRLLVAIAQQESNLCKKIPKDSFNCWGWGIHSRGTLRFSSWEEAIETVAKGLREEYIEKGLNTPEEIMRKYTPLSNGSWAAGVREFMAEIENGECR